MKYIRIVIGIIIFLAGLLIIWFKLPVSIRYYSEIKSGNEFAKNIFQYQKEQHRLPESRDWVVLERLNPIKPYKEWKPSYTKFGDSVFELVYLEGFDGPYLTYHSFTKKWEMSFLDSGAILR